MKGFVDFIREQGVVGLAVGFILGGAVSKVVASLVSGSIKPVISAVLGAAGDFKDAGVMIGSVRITWGNFIATAVDFIVIALVVYFGVKILRLDKIDKKKE